MSVLVHLHRVERGRLDSPAPAYEDADYLDPPAPVFLDTIPPISAKLRLAAIIIIPALLIAALVLALSGPAVTTAVGSRAAISSATTIAYSTTRTTKSSIEMLAQAK